MSPSGTNTNPLAVAWQSFVAALKGDILSAPKSVLVALGTNLKANPDPQNAVAQVMIAEATLALSGPALEKEGISQVADLIIAAANTLP